MTEEELDLLASAYLDGETTSEEVAMVEADPELLARVARLRSVASLLGAPASPPPALKEQHLAAALAAFDNPVVADEVVLGEVVPDEVVPDNNVTSIDSRRSTRSADRSSEHSQASAPTRSMPQWLPVAAALLLIGGGAIWLAGRSGSDDSAETASIAADTEAEDSTDAGSDADAARAVSADDSADTLAAESAQMDVEASEESDETMEDETTEDAGEDAAADAADEEEGASQPSTTTAPATTGGFFPQDPVLSFDEVPDVDQLIAGDLPEFRTDLVLSRCGPDFEAEPGSELIGHLPIEIESEAAELFLVVDGDGAESLIIVDETCDLLAP